MATHLHGRPIEVPRKVWFLIGGLAAFLILPAWILMYLLYQYSPMFDHRRREALQRPADVNWQLVQRLGEKVWRNPTRETFAAFNGGNWKVLCVNGGHSEPVSTLEAEVGEGTVPAVLRAEYARTLAVNVGDYDLMVSFADRSGTIDMLYFLDAGSMQSRKLSWCTRN